MYHSLYSGSATPESDFLEDCATRFLNTGAELSPEKQKLVAYMVAQTFKDVTLLVVFDLHSGQVVREAIVDLDLKRVSDLPAKARFLERNY